MHFFKGDATNCTATKGLKAHVVSLTTTVRTNVQLATVDNEESEVPGADDEDGDVDLLKTSSSWRHTVFADLALCPPQTGGKEVRALFYRQLSNAGMPTWISRPPEVPNNDVHIRVFFGATDAGPDQVVCQRAMP